MQSSRTNYCQLALEIALAPSCPPYKVRLPRRRPSELLKKDPKYAFLAEFGFLTARYLETKPSVTSACIEALRRTCISFKQPPPMLVKRIMERLQHIPDSGEFNLLHFVCGEEQDLAKFTKTMCALSPRLALSLKN